MPGGRFVSFLKEFLLVLLFLLLITSLFWFTELDIVLQSYFFSAEEGWYLGDHPFWQGLYEYGIYPGLIIFLVSFIVFCLGFFIRRLKKYRRVSALIFLLLLMGSGVIVNGIFKEFWGRPRPREIAVFGGQYRYVKPWLMGPAGGNSSFPSGHASVAFYLLFPYFIYRNRRKKLARLFLLSGLCFGLISGLGRMVQGGHFASDVIWSGGFMYLTGLTLHYILKMDQIKEI